jgi:hypothetical protein
MEKFGFPFIFECTRKIEYLKIKEDGEYIIFCMGANGSDGFEKKGGKGAIIETIIKLYKEENLEIIVGEYKSMLEEKEILYWHGGGGSFIFLNNSTQFSTRIPLVVSGGGGCSLDKDGVDGKTKFNLLFVNN